MEDALGDNPGLSRAQQIIGNLDEKGFLNLDLELPYPNEEIKKVISIIQTFEPAGIAACDLRHSLLLQLHRQGKEDTLAFQIINQYFNDLLHHRFSALSKKLKCSTSDVKEAIQKDLSSLNLQPAKNFFHERPELLIPDITLENEEGKWIIEINKKCLPAFDLSPSFAKHLHIPAIQEDEKAVLRGFMAKGKWLKRTLKRRHEVLTQIVQFLLKREPLFFSGEQVELRPLPLRDLCKELRMHESTVARALYKKNLFCPRGLLPLKLFFTATGKSNMAQSAKERLLQLIQNENKSNPFSDQELSDKIVEGNFPCSRRTVAKYRRELNIPGSNARKI